MYLDTQEKVQRLANEVLDGITDHLLDFNAELNYLEEEVLYLTILKVLNKEVGEPDYGQQNG